MEQRDEEQFAEFVRRHHASLFRTVYLLTGDYQEAEDVVQATFIKVHLRWRKISGLEHPGAYTRRIAVNQLRSWRRRSASRETPVLILEDVPSSRLVEDPADHHTLWAAVLALPPRQRAVIVLRYYEDLTEADTAATLGMAVGTVKSHCHAACERLARLLDEPSPFESQEPAR